jgi:hypothetical protein
MIVGCGGKKKNDDSPRNEVISIANKTSDPALKEHSISGQVGIAVNKDNKPNSCHPVANIVVRAFQWHPKDGIEDDNKDLPIDNSVADQAAINVNFGKWHLAGQTTTDKNGYYKLEDVLTPGLATFVEVISVCRPTDPMLPTTTIIADADMDVQKTWPDQDTNYYGHEKRVPKYKANGDENYDRSCPKGLVCRISESNNYMYQMPSKLTKDDRIVYAFRQALTTKLQPCAIPTPPKATDDYGVYDGKNNPVMNIILDDNTQASITPEDWYSRASYTPTFPKEDRKVGTTIVDIIEYLNNVILSACKDNKNLVKGTMVDLHYYPDITKFGKECGSHYYLEKMNPTDEIMPLGFNKYDTETPHYYAALPPYLHLQRRLGECYPQRFKEFILKSKLYRSGAKGEFRDLISEANKAFDDDKPDMQENNCYK